MKKHRSAASVQTTSTVDVPYHVTEPLPPIFGSHLCKKSKLIFMSESLPDLTKIAWISITEEDKLQQCADDALDKSYDLYEEAKVEAATRRHASDLGEVEKEDEDVFLCDICDEEFECQPELSNHWLKHILEHVDLNST